MSNQDLTQGKVPSSLAKLTAPMMMGVSSSILVQTLEMGFIGQLGTAYVAAITFTFPLVMILTSIALGISIGTSSVIARSVGSKQYSNTGSGKISDDNDVPRLGTHSLILVFVAMVVIAALCWLIIDPLFLAMGAEPEMLPLIHSYLDIYLPGSVLFTTSMICGSIMRANGSAAIPGIIMTVGSVINLIIDPFLIFGWFGLPAMELAGAATAMTLTRFLTLVVTLWYVYHGSMILTKSVFKGWLASTKRILHIGVPAIATNLIGPFTAAYITFLIADYGQDAVAGFGVAGRLEALAVMLLFALSGSIGPFVGQNWGAREFSRVRSGVNVSYIFSLSWGFIVAIPLFFFGEDVARLIDAKPEVVKVAGLYLALVPWSYGLWGVLMMSSASFNALGKPLPSTALSFARMIVVYVPLATLLNDTMGYVGIFAATLVSNALFGVVSWKWFSIRLDSMTKMMKAQTLRA
jgi:putative MATE family efflux protein